MDISVTPSEVRQFAVQLKQWSSMVQNTGTQINRRAMQQRISNMRR